MADVYKMPHEDFWSCLWCAQPMPCGCPARQYERPDQDEQPNRDDPEEDVFKTEF